MCPSDDTVDFGTLISCAKLSHASYSDTPLLHEPLLPIMILDQKCLLATNDKHDTLYIAFRGSDSFGDLLNNLNFIPKKFKNHGTVHGGYYHYYKAVQDSILKCVEKSGKSLKHIVTTGHSLGGACAVLASIDMCDVPQSLTCITFGTPPLADNTFVKSHQEKVPNCYRVINVEDWAPKLPIPGLQHVGKPIYLCTSPLDVKNTTKVTVPTTPQAIVTSHGMARYVSCIYQSRRSILPPSCQLRVVKKRIVNTINRLPPDAIQMPRMM